MRKSKVYKFPYVSVRYRGKSSKPLHTHT